MKAKYKLTPEIMKEIEAAAAKLPKFQKRDKNGKPRTHVLHVQKTKSGIPIKISEPVLVNHVVNMQKDYLTHGPEGIQNYIAEANKIMQELKQDPTNQMLNN